MAIDKSFDKGIKIMDGAEKNLASSLVKMEKKIYDEILKIFEGISITDGKLSNNQKTDEFLASLDRRIAKVLKDNGYNDSVAKYLTNFDKLSENIKKIQSQLNGINITATQINPFLRIEVSNTWDKLLGSGINKDFINPLRQGIYRNIMFGATIGDVEKLVKDFVITKKGGDSKLLRYVKQVSRDSISQFDGGLQQKIATDLDLNACRYIGSIILDSRSQCRKWVDEGLIKLDSDFAQEINSAINGTLYYDGKASSGMIKDTTLATFLANRGGYNCRHRAIVTKIFSK